MSVPSAVAKQEQQALELLKQSQGDSTGNTDDPSGQATPNVDKPEPQLTHDNPEPVMVKEGGENWEHKYRTLKGKFDVTAQQMTSLRQQVSELQSQVKAPSALEQTEQVELNQLRQSHAALVNELEALKSQSKQEEEIPLDPTLVEEYGEEFARALASQTKAIVGNVEKNFESKLKQQQQSFSQVATNQKQSALSAKLSAEGLSWAEIDNSPSFHQWLHEVDLHAGVQRQTLLMQAYNNGDLERTANFYRTFALLNQSAPNSLDSNPLTNHLSPNTTNNVDTAGDPMRVVWSDQQIAKLYEDHRTGRISNQEFNQLEQELFNSINS